MTVAVLTVRRINEQIRQSDKHRRDEIERRHNASRVTLPLALATIYRLVQKIDEEVAAEYWRYGPGFLINAPKRPLVGAAERDRFQPVSLPEGVAESFERFVASLDRPQDIRHVAELMATIQILLTQFNEFDLQKLMGKANLLRLAIISAKVRMLTLRIFNYSRFVDDSPFGIVGVLPNTDAWDLIYEGMCHVIFKRQADGNIDPELNQIIKSYKDENKNPWLEKY